ncbi:MAG: hypothetical protein QXE05_00160 [Nitrososphaeria archaeon]
MCDIEKWERWKTALILALANDMLDFLAVGAIPGLGDILDLGTAGLAYYLTGEPITLATAAEIVPGADFLPISSIATLYAYFRRKER